MAQALSLSRPIQGLGRTEVRLRLRAEALWRAYPRETVGLGMLGLVAAAAIAGSAHSTTEIPAGAQATLPAPPPLLLRQVAPDQTLLLNNQIPLASGPNPAAPAFVFNGDATARKQALECLASAVYYEAGSQDDNGERAVAQVVLNRFRHPAFPASSCSVVYEASTLATD